MLRLSREIRYDSGAHFPGTWALIPNHFHLLQRTGQTPLSKVMRRLMTGYAVTFNKRHKRSGHLFPTKLTFLPALYIKRSKVYIPEDMLFRTIIH